MLGVRAVSSVVPFAAWHLAASCPGNETIVSGASGAGKGIMRATSSSPSRDSIVCPLGDDRRREHDGGGDGEADDGVHLTTFAPALAINANTAG